VSINQQLLFFFSALGAFNGLLLCIYFIFIREPKHRSNIFLGLLLMMLSIRIGKSTFLFFNPGLSKSVLQVGLTACFFIGPALLLYVRSRTEKDKNHLVSILIGVLSIAFLSFGYLYSYEANADLWRSSVVRNIYHQWLFFILISAYLIKDKIRDLFDRSKKLSSDYFLMVNVFFGVTLIWLAYYTSSYTSYIVGAISFSFILYLSIFTAYMKNKKTRNSVMDSKEKVRYANKKIPEKDAQALILRIEDLMKNEKVFMDSTLNLKKLASKLNIPSHMLSQLLNDNLERNFTQFINEYRIEESKRMLIEDTHLKIQAIAELCGFNSNSTFYNAFKKITGTTPAEFVKKS